MIYLNPENRTWPIRVESTYTGSAYTACIAGMPSTFDGHKIKAVSVRVVNADGVPFDAACVRRGMYWTATFSETCFDSYGFISKGLKVTAFGEDANGSTHRWTVGVGDFLIEPDSPDASKGDPGRAVVTKGDDVYDKSEEIDGVQHYKRQVISYDQEMDAWGAKWIGDYILRAGEFVEVSHE